MSEQAAAWAGNRVLINRTIARLDTMHRRFGQRPFGIAMQQLLAFTFEQAGYVVVQNAVGVPDFTARASTGSYTVAVEAKTTERPAVVLSERALEGVLGAGDRAVVAVLLFPATTPRWLLIDARSLGPGTFELRRLAVMPQVDVGFDVQNVFVHAVDDLEPAALESRTALRRWVKEQRRKNCPPSLRVGQQNCRHHSGQLW